MAKTADGGEVEGNEFELALSPTKPRRTKKAMAPDGMTLLSQSGKVLRATHGSTDKPLRIGDAEVPCYVLEDSTRVLSGRGMQEALGLGQQRGSLLRSFIKNFFSRPEIQALVSDELAMALANPIRFIRPGRGGKLAVGYEATALADICDVVLEARNRNLLSGNDLVLATHCEILTRSFAKVGIIALVDEATGFQEARARDALEEILKTFISAELIKWAKTFPDDFYRELFRLRGIHYSEVSTKRPAYIGRLTNDIVYERLAPFVLEELKRLTPKDDKGRRKHHFHRRLTEEVGHPKLKEHLSNVITLMRASPNWATFYRLLQRSLPKHSDQIAMALDYAGDDDDLSDE